VKTELAAKFTALADDELILAHRNSEWTGYAPFLEEDIALANVAQDELGHAMLWYNLRQQLDQTDPDQLAFFRDANQFTNTQLVELPKGDWAFTMLRQYLFDTYEACWLESAQASTYAPLAAAAQKMFREERFHLAHSKAWVTRLGLGTLESKNRIQAALDILWPYAQQLFVPLPQEAKLEAGLLPQLSGLQGSWAQQVTAHLRSAGLTIPPLGHIPQNRAQHTEHLWSLLAEMQSVARWDPDAKSW
jgi:ring-1,2-phenylacetyl-CoA epoxidase subunit PaaC